MIWPPKADGGSTNAARKKLANGIKRRARPSEIDDTFGPPVLCAWRYVPGICRIQTTSPAFARKLTQRSGARLVMWSVTAGYLRVFEETIERWRARNLVTRYFTAANAAFLLPNSRQNPRNGTAGDQLTKTPLTRL